jgi:hypothetical protein
MSGKVHVDFWVFGFDVNFGTRPGPPVAISGKAFWELALQADTSNQPSGLAELLSYEEPADNQGVEEPKPHIFAATSGLMPKKNDKPQPGDPWTVQGTIFALTITFKFPISSGNIITKKDDNQ